MSKSTKASIFRVLVSGTVGGLIAATYDINTHDEHGAFILAVTISLAICSISYYFLPLSGVKNESF